MEAIRATALTKRFGDVRAVNGLDLTVESGELFALLGVNGAGKTTTIRMLCGLLPPDSGEAWICGKSILHESAEAKSHLGVSPQETAVASNLTVEENLRLMAGIYGITGEKRDEQIERLITALELQDVHKRRAGKLSGGYSRRLSIAMSLVSDPQVLFLDEPTLGLDVLARRALWTFIRSLHGKITIVLTTHSMDEASALSDRIGILSGGKLVGADSAESWIARAGADNFEDAFVRVVSGEVQI